MDEEIVKRFEDSEKAIEEYEKQLKSLRADIEVIVACSNVLAQARARLKAQEGPPSSEWSNAPKVDMEFLEKCRRFVERYGGGEQPQHAVSKDGVSCLQISNTPILRSAGFEDEDDDEDSLPDEACGL